MHEVFVLFLEGLGIEDGVTDPNMVLVELLHVLLYAVLLAFLRRADEHEAILIL